MTYQAYTQIFVDCAAALGCSFELGNSERILNRQSSELQYPLLWLEVPEITRMRDSQLMELWQGAFVLLTTAPPDDYAGQNSGMDAMKAKADAVLKRLQELADASPPAFLFDQGDVTYNAKMKWSPDDDFGWRIEIKITAALPEYCE